MCSIKPSRAQCLWLPGPKSLPMETSVLAPWAITMFLEGYKSDPTFPQASMVISKLLSC